MKTYQGSGYCGQTSPRLRCRREIEAWRICR
jgi:hypothetical protein